MLFFNYVLKHPLTLKLLDFSTYIYRGRFSLIAKENESVIYKHFDIVTFVT